jgi:hypothetical protein
MDRAIDGAIVIARSFVRPKFIMPRPTLARIEKAGWSHPVVNQMRSGRPGLERESGRILEKSQNPGGCWSGGQGVLDDSRNDLLGEAAGTIKDRCRNLSNRHDDGAPR